MTAFHTVLFSNVFGNFDNILLQVKGEEQKELSSSTLSQERILEDSIVIHYVLYSTDAG